METSLKTGSAQIFSCCPQNLSSPNFGGAAAPLAPPPRPVRLWSWRYLQPIARKKNLISMYRGALVSGHVNISVYFNKWAKIF